MEVIYDTLIFNIQKYGGASKVFFELIKREANNPSISISFLTSKLPLKNVEFSKLNLYNNKIYREHYNNYYILKNTNPVIKGIGKERHDIIYHSTFLRTAKNSNVKNIVTIHDFTHQKFGKGIKKLINNYEKNNAIKNADGIICVSECTKKDLLTFYPNFDLNKLCVIYNSAGEEFSPIGQDLIPSYLNSLFEKNVVVYVGDRSKYKRFDFALECLKNHDDSFLLIVGGKELSSQEEKSLTEAKINYRRISNVPSNVLASIYRKAFCLFYPSEYEGFGIPVLEAMKCKCPVIAMNKSSIPEVARGSCLLLNEYSPKEFDDAYNILKDKSKKIEIVEKEYSESLFFSWDKSYNQLLEFYDKILKTN